MKYLVLDSEEKNVNIVKSEKKLYQDTPNYYRFEFEFLGETMQRVPSYPYNRVHGEDLTIPRICVCETIYGCIAALQLPWNSFVDPKTGKTDIEKSIDFNVRGKAINIYLYRFDPKLDSSYSIVTPTVDAVPDSFITGEKWIIDSTEALRFTFVSRYVVRMHMHLTPTCYSRYSVIKCEMDESFDDIFDREVPDMQDAMTIYGEEDSFSFLYMNPKSDIVNNGPQWWK